MVRWYVDEELDTHALDKLIYGNQNKNNININRTQASSPKHNKNNGYKPNYNKNKDNYRKRERSLDDNSDDDYKSFQINESGDKVYKKRRTDYQKPRVNSFATKAKEDKHKKNQSGYKEKKEHYK